MPPKSSESKKEVKKRSLPSVPTLGTSTPASDRRIGRRVLPRTPVSTMHSKAAAESESRSAGPKIASIPEIIDIRMKIGSTSKLSSIYDGYLTSISPSIFTIYYVNSVFKGKDFLSGGPLDLYNKGLINSQINLCLSDEIFKEGFFKISNDGQKVEVIMSGRGGGTEQKKGIRMPIIFFTESKDLREFYLDVKPIKHSLIGIGGLEVSVECLFADSDISEDMRAILKEFVQNTISKIQGLGFSAFSGGYDYDVKYSSTVLGDDDEESIANVCDSVARDVAKTSSRREKLALSKVASALDKAKSDPVSIVGSEAMMNDEMSCYLFPSGFFVRGSDGKGYRDFIDSNKKIFFDQHNDQHNELYFSCNERIKGVLARNRFGNYPVDKDNFGELIFESLFRDVCSIMDSFNINPFVDLDGFGKHSVEDHSVSLEKYFRLRLTEDMYKAFDFDGLEGTQKRIELVNIFVDNLIDISKSGGGGDIAAAAELLEKYKPGVSKGGVKAVIKSDVVGHILSDNSKTLAVAKKIADVEDFLFSYKERGKSVFCNMFWRFLGDVEKFVYHDRVNSFSLEKGSSENVDRVKLVDETKEFRKGLFKQNIASMRAIVASVSAGVKIDPGSAEGLSDRFWRLYDIVGAEHALSLIQVATEKYLMEPAKGQDPASALKAIESGQSGPGALRRRAIKKSGTNGVITADSVESGARKIDYVSRLELLPSPPRSVPPRPRLVKRDDDGRSTPKIEEISSRSATPVSDGTQSARKKLPSPPSSSVRSRSSSLVQGDKDPEKIQNQTWV